MHKNSAVLSPYHYPAADKTWTILSNSFTIQGVIFKISKQFVFRNWFTSFCENLSDGKSEKVSLARTGSYRWRWLFDEITDIMNDDDEEDEEDVSPFWRIIYLNLLA